MKDFVKDLAVMLTLNRSEAATSKMHEIYPNARRKFLDLEPVY